MNAAPSTMPGQLTPREKDVLIDLFRVQRDHAAGRLRAAQNTIAAENDPSFPLRLISAEAISNLGVLAPDGMNRHVHPTLITTALEHLVVNVAAIAFQLDQLGRLDLDQVGRA